MFSAFTYFIFLILLLVMTKIILLAAAMKTGDIQIHWDYSSSRHIAPLGPHTLPVIYV